MVEVYNYGLIVLQMLMCMAWILCTLIMSMKVLNKGNITLHTSSDAYEQNFQHLNYYQSKHLCFLVVICLQCLNVLHSQNTIETIPSTVDQLILYLLQNLNL
jgi:hypothetical protein